MDLNRFVLCLLERLSLVDLDSAEAHRTLEDAIEFASQILSVDTDGVEPLYTVLERERLTLREDRVSDGNIQQDVLRNARVTEEENFVAPPENIPLEQEPRNRLGGEELTLEQLELFPADAAALEEELGDFRFKVGRTSSKRIRPSMLRLRQCVEVATLQIVLDAFESGGDASVRIHRKLAPFKCGIVCLSDDPALMPELRDLAKHLCNVLRKANLPVLDCSERNGGRFLAKQLHHLDSIAVPYCLLLRDQCLQSGLFQLRSRDTTLSETIHISDLPE
ncbi:conserved hypothetical protein [Culex quinquefasciatus]|uniref:Glutamyl-tRNA(Gln) amidotransferase subunit C, mitochondrial n=1 Tax=Culex quinquefasciatus TaxID=7176 RepID=B0WJS1_CULQU|nr:conserved hypothetical protein [Culex quinquefasciatus]EDS36560.1 conserved hypothetical protein [Culex quinquefasciatus]|eukprot:XP_001848955.1 conserved hypothetical protein [Culex quinquefasciatus]